MTSSSSIEAPVQPWNEVPRDIAARLRPYLDGISEEMIDEIQLQVPEFCRPRDDIYMRTMRLAVEGALQHFVDLVGDPEAPWEEVAEVYRAAGSGEAHEGRSLDALQKAMRMGARVAWRRLAEESERLDLSRATLGTLAEAIFVFIDHIAAAAAEGYTRATELVAGERDRRRRRLLDLLTADPPASPEAIADVARTAGWPLPRMVACAVLHERTQEQFRPPLVPPDVLVDTERHEPCLLIPDPDGPGRARLLDTTLPDWITAIGPGVPLLEAAKSLRWAREALALARRGILPDEKVLRCSDHAATLIVFKDEEFVRTVVATRLAPLLELRPGARERLGETMLACLQSAFNANEAAGRLRIHPQTVRYRLHQLEELFGDRLRDPDNQMVLEMALHAWVARAKPTRPDNVNAFHGAPRTH